MTRRHHALLSMLSVAMLCACERSVRVNPSAMPWEVAILNGSCESALQYRGNKLRTRPVSGYRAVRVMQCPDVLNATREMVRLLQVRNTNGELYWFEDELVSR